MNTTEATRIKIVKQLQKNKIGLTAREIAEDLKVKVQTISATMQQMALSGFVQRGELIEGEGQIWEVTELGTEKYGTKSDIEVKVTECPLDEMVNTGLATMADLKYGNDSISRSMSKVKNVKIETASDLEVKKPLNELELFTFEVCQLTDGLASSFIKLMQSKQAKPVENIDYKVETLHYLADILNSKHSATLREIAADLRGK